MCESKIVAGVGTSHVPTIGRVIDDRKTGESTWLPLFTRYEHARELLALQSPEVAIVVYNDHGSSFSLDAFPTFAVGVAETFEPADEGWGPRPVPAMAGDPELAWHIVEALISEEFDPTVCQRLPVDHGLTVPLSILWGTPESWPVRVIPIAVNVIQFPTPTPRRCFGLGRAIRRAVDSYAGDGRIVVVGTGGMSHQLQGGRAGLINKQFDESFLDAIVKDPDRLVEMSTDDYVRLAGTEGAELIMWLVMRGAMAPDVRALYSSYYGPVSNTAVGIVVMAEE